MRRLSAIVSLFGLLLLAGLLSGQESPAPQVLLLEIKGGIGPATTDYIRRGLDSADEAGAMAVILRIDTPGGLDAATRDINQAILASPVPVIGYVAPEGARAASAGTYILYATHVAAMAPATSLGAATPVSIGGGDAGGSGQEPADDGEDAEEDGSGSPAGGSAMERKVINDSVAYLRGLAERRDRDLEFAEAAVREAATLTSSQALERGVIEFIARDIDDLLAQVDGLELALDQGGVTLATAGAEVVPVIPDWRNRLLATITDPGVAYFLLMIGLYGLIFEGYNPGVFVPGIVGAIALLLALYALQVLPVNYVGVALIILGIALITAEMFLPSFGVLGMGGLVALVFGSIMLFDSDVPGFGVPVAMIGSMAVISGLAFMAVMYLALAARRMPVTTGKHELIGQPAEALATFHGRG
ncbi:MAG: nodulation protein NfeD, partial [Lysobacterales bacterium]